MEKFAIKELKSLNRNAVEGVTDSPTLIKNFQFKRSGGYIPLGGQRSDWLGERDLGEITLQDTNSLLYETNDPFYSEWRPSPSFNNRELLAQDEATFALITGPRIWFRNNLWTAPAGEFDEDMRLSLAPRAAVLAQWRRLNGSYVGGAIYASRNNQLFAGLGAGTVTFIEAVGTGTDIPAGTYEFVWVVESPTENGLVVHAIGQGSRVVAAAIDALQVQFSQVWEEGTLVRLFYRPFIQPPEDGYQQIGVAACNGVAAPSVDIFGPLGTFSPTGVVMVNFAPGKLEAHNSRIWGAAGKDVFVPLLPESLLGEFGGYMSVGSGNQFTQRQFGNVALGNMALRASNDYVDLSILEWRVRRTSRTLPIVIELFNNVKQAAPGRQLFGYLQWDVNQENPLFKAVFTDGTGASYLIMNQLVDFSLLRLGLTINSELILRNVQIKLIIQSVNNINGGLSTVDTNLLKADTDTITADVAISFINSTCNLAVTVGVPPTTYSITTSLISSNTTASAAWSTYSSPAATFIYLGALPTAFIPTCVLGNRYLQVNKIETGNGGTVYSLGDIEDYDPSVNLLQWTSSSPNAETWETNASSNMVKDYRPVNPDVVTGPRITANLTLAYSNTGSVNRGTIDNFLVFSPVSSSEITALASTPAGLLVFMENETFLIRGDPALQNLDSQRLTGTMGNDPGVIPARLGSVVFPIYQGEIYAVNLGGGDVDFGGTTVNISQQVWSPNDPFVQVVGEPLRNHVVAVTNSGRLFRFDIITKGWMNDPFDGVSDLRYVLSASVVREFGVRYNIQSFLDVLDSNLIDPVLVGWSAVDIGDKNLMKMWRRIEVFTAGNAGTPVLRWSLRGVPGVVTGIDKGNGRWVFTFPRGLVDVKADLEFEFVGVGADFKLEPPVVIDFAPRYRER